MAVKPRVIEYASEMQQILEERVVDDAVLPVGRFIIAGTAADTVQVAGQGVKVLGVSCEAAGGRVAAYTSDFADYQIDDKATVAKKCERFVLIEAEDQNLSGIEHSDQICSGATGKAEVAAASGDFIAGRDPSLVTYGGVVYVRFIPTWLTGEVVP